MMILGVNIAIASIAAAFWQSAFESATAAAAGAPEGAVGLFFKLMTSSGGVIYWLAILVGLFVFWRGKQMRAN